MDYPKISIVTPSYNQPEFLEKTICSVIDQNYPNLEYIVIDGGSNMATLDILEKYRHKLTHLISETDKGMYDALQKGFDLSTGDIMGWINADDMLHKNSLFTVAEVFAVDEKIKWITGIPTTIDKTDRIVHLQNLRKWSKLNYLQKDINIIQQESTYWKRSLWKEAGSSFNLKYNYAGDLALWAKFFDHEKLFSVKAPIGCFRYRPNEQVSSVLAKEYHAEVNEIIATIPKTEADEKALKKLTYYNRHPRLLKSDTIKGKHQRLYGYPDLIDYDYHHQKYFLTWKC